MKVNITNNGKDILIRLENEAGCITLLEKDVDQLVSMNIKNKVIDERKRMLCARKKALELELAQIEKELR